MIRPSPLKKGDKVGYIAPAGCVDENRIKPAINMLEKEGFNVVLGESCKSRYGYLAGTDEVRAYDINQMFDDKEIKGIFAVRGGYGSARILNKINYKIVKKNPKLFIGYSDITALHIAFNQICNLITIHGPMPCTELYKGLDKFTSNGMKKYLFSEKSRFNVNNPYKIKLDSLNDGEAIGRVVGGNLSVICSLLGSKYEINTKNKILFLEDIGEEPYKIDRMLTQLLLCGKLEECKGIILGYFTNCSSSDNSKNVDLKQLFYEIIKPLNKPTIYNFACGHSLPTISLPLGAKIYLNAASKKISIIDF